MKYSRMLSQALASVQTVNFQAAQGGLTCGRGVLARLHSALSEYYKAEAPLQNASPILLVLEQVKGRSLADFQTKLLWAQQELLAMRKQKLAEGN